MPTSCHSLSHDPCFCAPLLPCVRYTYSQYVFSKNDAFLKVAHKLINVLGFPTALLAECLILFWKRTRYFQPSLRRLFKSNLQRFEASDSPNLVPSRHQQEGRALRNPMMVSQPLNKPLLSLFLKMANIQRSSQYA